MINRLNETIRKQQTRRNTYMKNVTKILTVVVLCAAMFASTQRTNALGGNQFWPGDEANIAWFPAQVNSHAFVQLDGVGTVDGTSDAGNASILFQNCLLYTSPSPRDRQKSRMPSSA